MSTAIVSKTPLRQVSTVQELLGNQSALAQLQSVAASHMNPERMMRVVANAIRTTPKIQKCEPLSLLGALMTCASLGLEPNTVLGHAYLIPFENRKKGIVECQLVIGYRGYIALGHNSGEISFIDAGVHYSDDPLWSYRKGSAPVLEHEPGPGEGDKLHAYAVVGLKSGGVVTVCWPWEKIIAHRDRYSTGWQTAVRFNKTKDSPWTTAEDAMAMKTMIRQLTKFMPMSTERLVTAISVDGAKADYQAFAMNPMGGIASADAGDDPIEAEVEDGEEGAEEEQKVVEDKTEAPAASAEDGKAKLKVAAEKAQGAAVAAKERSAEPYARKARDDDAPAPVAPKEAQAAKEEEKPAPFARLIEQIRADMYDLPPSRAGEALDVYEPDLVRMRKDAPEVYDALLKEVTEREEGAGEG